MLVYKYLWSLKFLFLARKFALISSFSLLDTNQWAMNHSYRFACLQISVKYKIPVNKCVKRQVLDISYTVLLRLDVKKCHCPESPGILGSDGDWLDGCDCLMFWRNITTLRCCEVPALRQSVTFPRLWIFNITAVTTQISHVTDMLQRPS